MESDDKGGRRDGEENKIGGENRGYDGKGRTRRLSTALCFLFCQESGQGLGVLWLWGPEGNGTHGGNGRRKRKRRPWRGGGRIRGAGGRKIRRTLGRYFDRSDK